MRKLKTAGRVPVLFALIALLLSSCTGVALPQITPEATPGSTQPSNETNPLADTSWQLVAIQTGGGETPVLPGSTVTLEFSADGRAGGNSGCNTYGGSYQVQGDVLTLDQLVSTLRACVDEQIQEQEAQYLEALRTAERFEQNADQLIISGNGGSTQLIFAPLSADAPEAPGTETPGTETPGTETPGTETPPAGAASDVDGIVRAERIAFEGGDNSATQSGTLASGEGRNYALSAAAGQVIDIQATSTGAPISLAVYAPGGESWEGEAQTGDDHSIAVQVTAPVHGDYLIVLSPSPDAPSDVQEISYELTVTIGSTATPPTPQPGPVDRIFFEPDGSPTERSGLMPSGPGVELYLISANAGRTLTVDATSDGTPLSMTIEGPSGNQWIPEMRTVPEGYAIGHQLTLPEPGYYLVTLTKADHTPSTNYTITFTLE